MRNVASMIVVLALCCALVALDSGRSFAQESVETSPSPSIPQTPESAPPSNTEMNASTTGQATKRPSPSRTIQRPKARAPVYTGPIVEPQVTNQTKQALGFYGGYAARATLNQQPRRTPIQAAGSRPMFRQAKPFQAVYREPTVSPYLNLYRDELSTESAPNYFAFVRPQLDQIETNRLQQRNIQQLRGQLQQTGTVVGPKYRATGLPGTGTHARYMDTAQFYGGLRR